MSQRLKVAVVHPHLRSGGVSRVIQTSVAALADSPIDFLILSGSPPEVAGWTCVRQIMGLDYVRGFSMSDPIFLTDRLEQAATEYFGCSPDVWHLHNHSLGRQIAFAGVASELARRGARLLLQIHDFAEDGRPSNYQCLRQAQSLDGLYPYGSAVHYALLTHRDIQLLKWAGLPETNLHHLPNSTGDMSPRGMVPPASGEGIRILYPTRALRRKNLGEMLYWAARLGHRASWQVTLAPTGTEDLRYYQRWKELAHELRLPVEFEAGLAPGASFDALLSAADTVITTSVAEGFGLAFIESAMQKKPLLGRNLREVTSDFSQCHLCFPCLYERCAVPIQVVGYDLIRASLQQGWTETLQRYGREPHPEDGERLFSAIAWGDHIDLGFLDEFLQERAVREAAKEFFPYGDSDPPLLQKVAEAEACIEGNAQRVREHFGPAAYAAALSSLYQTVASSPSGPLEWLPAGKLLDFFLSPERFCLLRT